MLYFQGTAKANQQKNFVEEISLDTSQYPDG